MKTKISIVLWFDAFYHLITQVWRAAASFAVWIHLSPALWLCRIGRSEVAHRAGHSTTSSRSRPNGGRTEATPNGAGADGPEGARCVPPSISCDDRLLEAVHTNSAKFFPSSLLMPLLLWVATRFSDVHHTHGLPEVTAFQTVTLHVELWSDVWITLTE